MPHPLQLPWGTPQVFSWWSAQSTHYLLVTVILLFSTMDSNIMLFTDTFVTGDPVHAGGAIEARTWGALVDIVAAEYPYGSITKTALAYYSYNLQTESYNSLGIPVCQLNLFWIALLPFYHLESSPGHYSTSHDLFHVHNFTNITMHK